MDSTRRQCAPRPALRAVVWGRVWEEKRHFGLPEGGGERPDRPVRGLALDNDVLRREGILPSLARASALTSLWIGRRRALRRAREGRMPSLRRNVVFLRRSLLARRLSDFPSTWTPSLRGRVQRQVSTAQAAGGTTTCLRLPPSRHTDISSESRRERPKRRCRVRVALQVQC